MEAPDTRLNDLGSGIRGEQAAVYCGVLCGIINSRQVDDLSPTVSHGENQWPAAKSERHHKRGRCGHRVQPPQGKPRLPSLKLANNYPFSNSRISELASSGLSRQYHLQAHFKSSKIRKLTGTRKRVMRVEKRMP